MRARRKSADPNVWRELRTLEAGLWQRILSDHGSVVCMSLDESYYKQFCGFSSEAEKIRFLLDKDYGRVFLRKCIADFGSLHEKQIFQRIKVIRESIMLDNMGLVGCKAKEYAGAYGLDTDDLFQEGTCGLIKAVDRYDLSVGAQFSTYAMLWIRHCVNKAVYGTGFLVRLPVHRVHSTAKYRRVKNKLWSELGREPTESEVAYSFGIAEKDTKEYSSPNRVFISVDASTGSKDEEGLTFQEIFRAPDWLKSLPDNSDKDLVNRLLEKIDQGGRYIIIRAFGLKSCPPTELVQIAEDLQMTELEVKRKLRDSLSKMRSFLRDFEDGI